MSAEEVILELRKITNGVSADKILPGIVTLIFSGIIIYIVRAFLIRSLRRKEGMDEQQKTRFVRFITTLLWIVAIVIVLGGYGMKTNTLIAILGVAGLALSFSAQGLLSNFFSGCILPITKPFREGDVIEVCGRRGFIEHIGYLNTTIVTVNNITVVIPNSSLTSGTILNYSTKDTLQVEHSFTVAASMPDEQVRTALLEAIRKDPLILTDPEPFIHLESFNSMNATYIVRVSCNSRDYNKAFYSIVENVRVSFEEHSIVMGTEMIGMGPSDQNGDSDRATLQSDGADGKPAGIGRQTGR